MNDWFNKTAVDARTTMLTEPFVHDFMRANICGVFCMVRSNPFAEIPFTSVFLVDLHWK